MGFTKTGCHAAWIKPFFFNAHTVYSADVALAPLAVMWAIRGSCSQSVKLWFMKLWRHPSRQLRSFTKTRTHASHTPMPQWFLLLWKRQEAKGRHLNQTDSQITGVKRIAHSPLTHTHAHTHGSLCANFYINKPVSFSSLEEHTPRCTKCVNILQTADRLTANHVSLSSAHLITLTVAAVHVAAAEVQQHAGTQSAVAGPSGFITESLHWWLSIFMMPCRDAALFVFVFNLLEEGDGV